MVWGQVLWLTGKFSVCDCDADLNSYCSLIPTTKYKESTKLHTINRKIAGKLCIATFYSLMLHFEDFHSQS